MNIIIEIFTKVIIAINKIINSLSKKTIETIKMSFYGLIFIIIVIGVIIGYNSGKGDAKKYGKPLNEDTNEIFDSLVKKNRDKDQYGSMLESELIEEQKETQLKKVEFPANENLKTEIETKIIEPDKDIKKDASPSIGSRKIADIERTDDKSNKSDVRELKKDMPKYNIKNKSAKEITPMDNSKIIEK
jgi:hypothetical protein